MDEVILVDSKDNQIGVCEKLEAHQKGLLHRAFSVFLFNDKKEWLLQQRADGKYHSGGLWSNTCCSHPKPNETIETAASRRLFEEVGLKTKVERQFSFEYTCSFEDGLIENELDHIFIGNTEQIPALNLDEVQEMKFISYDDLKNEIQNNPNNFSVWFKLIYERVWKAYQ
jgi:isopentenyl-diphosphate delta-isomerase